MKSSIRRTQNLWITPIPLLLLLLMSFNSPLFSQSVEYDALSLQEQADFSRWLGWVWGDGNPIDTDSLTGVRYTGPSHEPFNTRYDELVDRLLLSDLPIVLANGGTNTRRFKEPWDFWTNSIPGGAPNDSQLLRDAIRNPNFLAGIIDTEGGNCGSTNSYYIDDHFYAPSHPDTTKGWGLLNFGPGRMIQLYHLLGSTYGFEKTSMQVGITGDRLVYADEFERATAIQTVVDQYLITEAINQSATNNNEAQLLRVRIYVDSSDWNEIRAYGYWNSPKRYPDCNNPVTVISTNKPNTNLTLAYPEPNPNAIPLIEIGAFGNAATESSGLAHVYNSNNGNFEIWSVDDYDNLDEIYSYQLDDLQTTTRTIDVTQSNTDWEDLAKDDADNIYIPDFGNWVDENDLKIIKTPDPKSYASSPPNVEIIDYVLPTNGILESEALLHFNDHLYLFTKTVDASLNPSLDENYTYCYKIPDAPNPAGGAHTAALHGSMQVISSGDDPKNFAITGADISPDKKKVVLISYEKVWIFSCFENDDFFSGTVNSFEIPFQAYEGVSFINNHELVLSTEGEINDPHRDSKLFYVDIASWIDDACKDCEKTYNGNFAQDGFAWTKFTSGGAVASLNTSNGLAAIDIQDAGTAQWHIGLRYKNLVLEQGKTYKVSYEAYAEDDRSITVVANSSQANGAYLFQNQSITTVPTRYEHEFTMVQDSDFKTYLSFNFGAQMTHQVFIDNVSFTELECTCPENRYFSADINNTIQHFESSNYIYGKNIIYGDSIIYDAAQLIELDPGFEVKLGATFEAYIDGCGGD